MMREIGSSRYNSGFLLDSMVQRYQSFRPRSHLSRPTCIQASLRYRPCASEGEGGLDGTTSRLPRAMSASLGRILVTVCCHLPRPILPEQCVPEQCVPERRLADIRNAFVHDGPQSGTRARCCANSVVSRAHPADAGNASLLALSPMLASLSALRSLLPGLFDASTTCGCRLILGITS